jgi:murein L,D-transpeptidase YcbB/YkuD
MTLRHLPLLAGLGLLLLLSAGCRTGLASQAYAKIDSNSSRSISGPQPLSADGEASLRNFLNEAQMPDLHWPNFANYQKEAKELYDAASGTLPWIDQGKPTAQASAIIRLFRDAADKGLRPEDYDGPQWDERLAKFDRSAAVPESDLVKFDLALTVSTMRYVSDLNFGRINPRVFHFGLDIDQKQIDLSEFLRQRLVGATDVDAILETVEPPSPIYRRTQDALRKYMEFARLDDGELLPFSSQAIKSGDSYAGVPRLARLLTLLRDLPAGLEEALGEGDYEGALVDAVKHFQLRHGLEPNGILDAPTLRKLNTPLSRRVTQLQLAMERMRWLPRQFERPPIVVNIPEFRLYAVNDEYRSVFTMNVVVGKAYRHQTPVFASVIRSVIFRPYWNVPQSILEAELIPDLKKNPSYFSENSYEIVDKDERVVSEGPVSKEVEAQLRAGELRVRQTPGPQNALGLMKFEFPNEYDVYMHGTPAKQLFSRSRRDFSHGCIRVEDPVALAKWVFQGMPEWKEDSIRAAMNGEETTEVKLKEPIPVLILYSTAVVLEGEEPHFFEDIYGLDADLERALAQHVP